MPSPLFDPAGRRHYLTQDERAAFLAACREQEPVVRTYCETLALTGCRESEPLGVARAHVSLAERSITFRTLKRRRQDIYRRVPVPDAYLDTLALVHGLRQPATGRETERLWPFSRSTAWRYVQATMATAEISSGPHRAPKALRHAFAVHAILSGVPVTQLSRWMGHARLETTAVYLDLVGPEEREIAARMWG